MCCEQAFTPTETADTRAARSLELGSHRPMLCTRPEAGSKLQQQGGSCSRLPLSPWHCATVHRQRLPACRRPRYAAAPALGVNTRSRRSYIAAVHCRRPCLSRGRRASVKQSARFRHSVNVAAHGQATPEDCTVREKLLFPTT